MDGPPYRGEWGWRGALSDPGVAMHGSFFPSSPLIPYTGWGAGALPPMHRHHQLMLCSVHLFAWALCTLPLSILLGLMVLVGTRPMPDISCSGWPADHFTSTFHTSRTAVMSLVTEPHTRSFQLLHTCHYILLGLFIAFTLHNPSFIFDLDTITYFFIFLFCFCGVFFSLFFLFFF